MLKLQVIGNLGSDAELRKDNGREYITMSIADTQKRRQPDGQEYEVTKWVSATLNGNGGNLLPFLKKGTKVCAWGDCDVRVYHSEKERRMVGGLNLFIRDIELVGAQPDAVPRDLYDTDGVAHRVAKYYHVDDAKLATLISRSGTQFQVDANGWVMPIVQQAQEQQPQDTEQPISDDQATTTEKPKKGKK